MIPNPDRDPRIRALAETLHQIRPGWNRPGIAAALKAAAATHTLETLTRAAIDAAFDTSAATPAVIKSRDGAAWSSKNGAGSDEKPVQLRTPPGSKPVSLDGLPAPGDYTAGANLARALLHGAKIHDEHAE